MTAINIVIEPDAAYLFTDGAGVSEDGKLQYVTSKVFPIPHLSAAMAVSGATTALTTFGTALMLDNSANFDELVRRFGAIIQLAVDRLELFGQRHMIGADFDVVLAGWSDEHRQPLCYALSSYGKFGAPMSVVGPLATLAMPPVGPAIAADGTGVMKLTDAVRVMELQRRMKPERPGGGKPIHAIGCFVQETRIRRDSVSSRIVHRWPDRVGEAIAP